MGVTNIKRENSGVSWGVPALDDATQGLAPLGISILETSDHLTGILLLSKFIFNGIQNGDTRVLITPDPTESVIENLKAWGMDYTHWMEEEKLYVIQIKPDMVSEIIKNELYTDLFNEITGLCGGVVPRKIGLHQVDGFINLENPEGAAASVRKFSLAVTEATQHQATVLGHFQNFKDPGHEKLAIELEKTFLNYYQLMPLDKMNPGYYQFIPKKMQNFGWPAQAVSLIMNRQAGLIPMPGLPNKQEAS